MSATLRLKGGVYPDEESVSGAAAGGGRAEDGIGGAHHSGQPAQPGLLHPPGSSAPLAAAQGAGTRGRCTRRRHSSGSSCTE